MRKRRIWISTLLVILGLIIVIFFSIGFHKKPRFINNFEEEEYGKVKPFVEPTLVNDGLAVYLIGDGEPVLLFPYPHGHTIEPMAQSLIAKILAEMGRSVITFDVPGAYRSTRVPTGDIDEMISSADEALNLLEIRGQVDVVGHSMGGLSALAYAIERPERTNRLVLANSMSGFPSAARCGFPGSAFRVTDPEYWQIIIWGVRLNSGRGNLALHKQLQNLMEGTSYHNKSFFIPVEIDADDYEKGVPIRTIWSRNMYNQLSFADKLGNVRARTLILAGKFDTEASIECSYELLDGIPDGQLIVFEQSGHFPYIEEADLFDYSLDTFLNE